MEKSLQRQLSWPGNAHFCDALGCPVPANKEWKTQAWGHTLQHSAYTSIIVPGTCQRLIKYHFDPIQKVSQSGTMEYGGLSSQTRGPRTGGLQRRPLTCLSFCIQNPVAPQAIKATRAYVLLLRPPPRPQTTSETGASSDPRVLTTTL